MTVDTWRVRALAVMLMAMAGCLHGQVGRAVDVCRAARMRGVVVVRGSGQIMDEGLTLASLACPIVRTGDDRYPTVILVRVERFATEELRSRFRGLEVRRGPYAPVLELEVRGELRCQAGMKWIRSGKDVVGADGFGDSGLYKCVLGAGELMAFQVAPVQPARRGVASPPVPKQ